MGIPSFYRWLVQKYPRSVSEVIEEVPPVVNGVRVPIDTSLPNPNGVEFDNLYLDMNGIIHPCFHPEDQPAPKTYEEVFKNVFKYIDRIFSIVRPRKLLYMAVDGVAPRAKMNQQRARRFRAAKDAADKAAEAERLKTKTMDSNVITPGTEFMALLSSALQYYIHLRMNTDPGWRGIKVILSDANVPGEGEHKIMSYIRLQRSLPGFDPNTRHCLYGLDADLIMLALATHEVHFSILREDVTKFRVKDTNAKNGKWSSQRDQKRQRKKLTQSKVNSVNINDGISTLQFQFLNIWILRDYLEHDIKIPDQTVKADFERLIDDFVFMCLFAGNDFLPHVPSLEISEGAIDLLMAVYKREFVRMGGYLTNSFEVNLERVELYLKAVGSHESAIFRKRSQTQEGNRKHGRSSDSSKLPHAKRLKNSESLLSSSKVDKKKTPISISKETSYDANAVVDKVKLGDKGWKERFYTEKFETKTKDDQEKIRSHAVLKYIEGICWVMHYYYQGVCSWQWFYPYHYGPFASDFYALGQLEIQFTLGEPFKPLNQLMSVLPAASAHALPLFYRVLMTDSSSPISDFYPTDFELDMNGKRFAWQAVCKLPFIMESRLLAETAKVEHTLTDEEKQRNSLGMDRLFVHISHPLTVKIFSLCEQNRDHPVLTNAEVEHKIDPKLSNGMNGYIYISDKPVLPPEIYSPIEDMEMITKNETIFVFYKYPAFHPHIPRLPEGVMIPVKSIRSCDVFSTPMLWHEKLAAFGRRFSERPIPKSISGPCLAKSARRLVSEHYLMKQRTVGSTEPEGHVTADGSGCHASSQATICKKELDDGRKSCSSGSKPRKGKWPMKQNGLVGSTELKGHLTTYSSHQPNSKETVRGERSQETNVLVSESYLIGRQQVMGPAESNSHFTTGSSACQLNSDETVYEKEGDDIKQSCITGSEPHKKKKVKKHRSSIANGLQSESCPMKQQQGMGSTELDDCITKDHSTSQQSLKETADEQEPDNGEKSCFNVNARKERVHEKELNCGEASSIKLSKSQKNRRARKRYKELRVLQSQGAEEANCDQSRTNIDVAIDCSVHKANSKERILEERPEPCEQSCLNGSRSLKRKRVKKKHQNSVANEIVSESCPIGHQVVMGAAEYDGTTGGSVCQPNSKETVNEKELNHVEASSIKLKTVHEKELNHVEASSIKLSKSQKNRRARKRCKELRVLQSQGAEEANCDQSHTNIDVAMDCSIHQASSKGTVLEKRPEPCEQSCLNGSRSPKRKRVKKKRQNTMGNEIVSESCPIGHQVVMGAAELNGYVATRGSLCRPNSEKTVNEKELNHGEASSIKVSRS
ncbi:5'-3' exoribonuclease 4-like [Telopea speciosissima]|nr:5'-3' exoribonuclease 4-like [Telopea speciosissima]